MQDDKQRALSRERAFLLGAALAGDFAEAAARLQIAVADVAAPTDVEVRAGAMALATRALPEREREAFADALIAELHQKRVTPRPSAGGLGHIFANAAATTPTPDTSYRSLIMVTCSRCGAPQQEVCVFACRYCRGSVS